MKINITLFFALSIIVFVFCESESTSTSSSDTKTASDPGKLIYKKYCVSCHGMDGSMGLNGAKNLNESSMNLAQRKLLIANGKNTMTPFKKILTAEQISQVAEYTMKTFSTNE